MSASFRFHPSAELCFGRKEICAEIINSVREAGSTLLYGGRQSGKTSVLLRVADDLASRKSSTTVTSTLDVPVYVDLMKLFPEATPGDFFRRCAELSSAACQLQVQGYRAPKLLLANRPSNLDTFEQDICRIRDSCGQTEIQLFLLCDESKRILGGRFPREFRDNLFYLLYGSPRLVGCCGFVFAGAQELEGFLEDGTSPIGSRAAQLWIENFLTAAAVNEMMLQLLGKDAVDVARRRAALIQEATGGHAGLSALFAVQFAGQVADEKDHLLRLMARYQTHHAGLFHVWRSKLSREALAIHDLLVAQTAIHDANIPTALARLGMDPFRSDSVCRELSFTGIARLSNSTLHATNATYLGWARRMDPRRLFYLNTTATVHDSWTPKQILTAMRPEPPERWSGLYVLGCFDRRITFYAQQARALTLIRALVEDQDLRPGQRVGIIGAGAAGATAAVAAACLGCSVVLYEEADEVLHIQAMCKNRFLHPHIYDWPQASGSNSQANLPFLDWSADVAEQVVLSLRAEIKTWVDKQPGLEIKTRSQIQKIEKLSEGQDGKRLRLIGNDAQIVQDFHVVIIAAGFGIEGSRFQAVQTPSYWGGDPLDGPLANGTEILVSGSGDGGLIDLARATLREFRHASAVAELLSDPSVLSLATEMESIDEPARTARSQGREPINLYQKYLELTLSPSLEQRLRSMVRSETKVTFNYENPGVFTLDSALINRLLALLICRLGLASLKLGRVTNVLYNTKGLRRYRVEFDSTEKRDFHMVLLRYGPPRDFFEKKFRDPELLKACQELSGKLSRLGLTGTLDPGTRDFFARLKN